MSVRTLIVAIVMSMSALASAKPRPPSPAEQALARLNKYRTDAGVAPVTLDAKASASCMEHANYMLLNKGTPAMVGLNAHKQDPSLPGASPAGAACGEAADLFPGVSDLDTAVDGFMAGLYHRRPILDPTLDKIGVGYATLPNGSLMAAVMFIDRPSGGAKGAWPVAYPANGQVGVPLELSREVPNPSPTGHGGYPITLQFPAFDKITAVTATLVDDKKHAIPFHLSTPEQPATSFGQFGVISVIPKDRLRPATTYTISITTTWTTHGSETRAWSFTTIPLVELDAADENAMMDALGKPSLVRGTAGYGGMMDSATAFIQLASTTTRVKLISVIIPIEVWRSLSKGAPGTWKGKKLAIEATPQLVASKFLNLAISSAAQLSVVP
jgi:hypothetical protein